MATLRDPERMSVDELILEAELHAALLSGPAQLAATLEPDTTRIRAHHTYLSNLLADNLTRQRARVGISTPPQVGKSWLCAEWLIVWQLALNPTHRYMIISNAENLALRASKSIRRLIRKHGTRLGIQIEYGSETAAQWSLETGGGVKAVGIGGGITGERVNGVVTDDVIKGRIEAASKRTRDSVWEQLLTNVRTRLIKGWWVDICTRWHMDDMQARFAELSGEDWRFVALPAFATPGDPLGRAPGDPLTHPDYADDDLPGRIDHWQACRSALRSRPAEYASLYMCDPQPEAGTLLDRAVIEAAHRTDTPTVARSVLAVDPADSDSLTEGDANGISHVIRDTDGLIWIMGDYTMHGPIEEWTRRVVELANELDVDEIVYERNKGGRAVGMSIRSAWSASIRRGDTTRKRPQIVDVNATRNKITRASPVAEMITDGEVVFGAWLVDVEDQFATYQPGSPDSPDNMDAAVWGVTRLYEPKTRAAGAGVALNQIPVNRGPSRSVNSAWRRFQ